MRTVVAPKKIDGETLHNTQMFLPVSNCVIAGSSVESSLSLHSPATLYQAQIIIGKTRMFQDENMRFFAFIASALVVVLFLLVVSLHARI
jgi:hypothetical protein